jgi:competence protein ComEC
VLVVAAGVVAVHTQRQVLVLVCLGIGVGTCVGAVAEARALAVVEASIPGGRVSIRALAVTDPWVGFESSALIQPVALAGGDTWSAWMGPLLLLKRVPSDVMAGEMLEFSGVVERSRDTYRGRPIAGVVSPSRIQRIGGAPNPMMALGNSLRRRVLGALDEASREPAGALVAGFLIGDVSSLPDRDADALRRSGLSHFVAVSGSNVALFLAAWWLALGPLGMGPRSRAALGMIGIVLFAVVTRWEPSVVRASVMAGLVLVGRSLGRPVSPLTALGGAVTFSLVAAPDLAKSIGFSLSVAATLGIMIGSTLWGQRRPRWLWATLGATISAQIAVAPLLLLWFGSVPLLAPVTNLLAAPLVASATAIGGIGVLLHVGPLIDLGVAVAQWVLVIARIAADLPQLGVGGVVAGGAVVVAVVRLPLLRPLAALVVPVIVVVSVAPPGPLQTAVVDFLDVGQGDATLVRGRSGATILIDGGPDPALLRSHLARLRVRRIDLVIVTHRHADHTTGLLGLAQTTAVGAVWYPDQLGEGDSPLDALVREWRSLGIPTAIPRVGESARLGDVSISVLGPLRHYASPNDESIVVLVEATSGSLLMSGDIETFAQADLGPIRADVLKVPHQGAATSDLGWLAASAPSIAVISVGPNTYGHPSPDVVSALEQAGARVLRTDRDGTITLRFDAFAPIDLPSAP